MLYQGAAPSPIKSLRPEVLLHYAIIAYVLASRHLVKEEV